MPKFLIEQDHIRRDSYEVEADSIDEAYAMVSRLANPDISDNPRIAIIATNEFVDYDGARAYELDSEGNTIYEIEEEE